MKIYTPPEPIFRTKSYNKIFLAGSIEMGKAEMWQDRVIDMIVKKEKEMEMNSVYYNEYEILNPRRKDWDSSWVQEFKNPQFFQQVTWELKALDEASAIIFYFSPETQSPITLMELGYIAGRSLGKSRVVVCCPNGFWRKGNVDIMCNHRGIAMVDTLEEAVNFVI